MRKIVEPTKLNKCFVCGHETPYDLRKCPICHNLMVSEADKITEKERRW